jgi:uncharacterized protein (TIGR02246 family)
MARFWILFICLSAAASSPDERAIRETIQRIVAADNRRDLAGAVALYTADAILLPPGLPPISGESAIRERYRGLYSNALPSLEQHIEEIVVFKDHAFVRGVTSGLFPAGPNEPARAINDKFVMLLRREQHQWRIARLMWNSSGAPAATH